MDSSSVKSGQILAGLNTARYAPLLWLLLPQNTTASVSLRRYVSVYVTVAVITYFPPLLVAAAQGHSVSARVGDLMLPYLFDVNIMIMLLVCLPTLIVLHMRDAHLLPAVLRDLADQQTTVWKHGQAECFRTMWERRFAWINVSTALLGIAVAVFVAYLNYMASMESHGRSWQTVAVPGGSLNPPGWWFLIAQVGVFWFVLTLQVGRMVSATALLTSVSRKSQIQIHPLHPDHVGGLGPVATVAIQCQGTIAMIGVNVGSVIVVLQMLGEDTPMWIGTLAAAAYGLLAPAIFVGPLLPFRPHMLASKAASLKKLADQFNSDLRQLFDGLDDDVGCRAKLEKLDRLKQLHTAISELPEWPLDMRTLRRFGGTLVAPVVSVAVSWLFKVVVEGP